MTSQTLTDEIKRRLAAGERDFQGTALPGADLQGADLSGTNLRGANLRGANLKGANLKDARLIRTDLGMADMGMCDFSGAELNGADFRAANLKGANLEGASLDGANLRGADLHGANLREAKLVRADLSRADLRLAALSRAELRGADLRGADLAGAHLTGASLQSATLHGADLRGADLTSADLRGANLTDTLTDETVFTSAKVGSTVFADLDLRKTIGLEAVHHLAPSTVGTDTLSRSAGRIPDAFLRGCGLALWEVLAAQEYDPSLTPAQAEELQARILKMRAKTRLPRKRILIAYSQPDAPFADAIRRCLEARGIFSWANVHEEKGAFRERQSRLAIQHDLTFLLVLSRNSVNRDWAEHEARLARKLEQSSGEEILCPVSLDESWKEVAWRRTILEVDGEKSVFSFADWQHKASLEEQCVRLLDGLVLFHPRPEEVPTT